jgi:hypothetical protein
MAAPGSRTSAARLSPIGPIAGLLERLRRTGGVPAAASDDVAAELAPVFAALDELEERVARVDARARDARARFDAETEEEIERMMADARVRAAAERDDALRAALRAADTDAAALVRAAEADAQRIREAGSARTQAVVAKVVARVLEEAG